jgi:hypothetical protein
VIAGCEAAWEFFGGMFGVLAPDNLKPVVDKADRLEPRWNREQLGHVRADGTLVKTCHRGQVGGRPLS